MRFGRSIVDNKREIFFLLTLLILWGLFFWRYLTPNEADRVSFPEGDFTHHFYVYRAFAFNELKSGSLPLWMPCVFCGYPFQADPQSGLLYPPVALSLVGLLTAGREHFPLRALEFEVLLHFLATSLFIYAFLRHKVKKRLSALLGSVIFTYGGYLTSYPPLQASILEVATWLPLALLGVRLLNDTGRPRYILLSSFAISMSILASHPQTYTHLIYATIAYYVYLCWMRKANWKSALLRIGAVLSLALCLSAVQLLPSFEYARLSTRAEIPFEEAGRGFPPEDVLQFVLTGLVSHWQPLYIGILPLVFILIAIVTKRSKDMPFWLGLSIVALVLSFGKNIFGFEFAYLFWPFYNLFRGQERHAFLVSFSLSVLAAYGADAFLSPLGREEKRFVLGAARFLRSFLPIVLLMLIFATFLHRLGIDPSDSKELPKHLGILFVVLLFVVALIYMRLYKPRAMRLVGPLAVMLVVFDLFSLNRTKNYAEPHEVFPVTPLIESISAGDGFFRIQDDWRLPGHTACMHGLQEIWGISPVKLANYEEFMEKAPEEVRWKLLDVKYVVTWRGSLITREGKQVEAELVYREGEGEEATYVYRISADFPRAFVVEEVRFAKNREELYAILSEPDFDPHRTAVLLEPISLEPTSQGPRDESGGVPVRRTARVKIVEYTSTYVKIEAELEAEGLLVLSEVIYPGWRVCVNGERAKMYEAYGILRAVKLPPGFSEVRFIYKPLSLYFGASLSLITIFGCVFAFFFLRRR